MRNVFNHMLVALCIVDLLVILSNMELAVKTMNPNIPLFSHMAPYTDCLCHISITASVFLTMALTVERYYAVCSPHTYQARVAVRGHCWILLSYIIPTILGAVILNIPKVLQVSDILSAKHFSRDTRHMFIKIGIISQVFHPLATTCIIPICALSFLNYRILIGSKRMSANSQNDISMAKIMMTIVTVFIILNIPKMVLALYEVMTIPNILECYRRRCHYYITSKRWVADSLIRYLVMLNSSTNFLIYCFVGSNFRRTLMETLKPLITKWQPPVPVGGPGQDRSLSLVSHLQPSIHTKAGEEVSKPENHTEKIVKNKVEITSAI